MRRERQLVCLDLEIWEYKCDEARGLNGQIVLDNLHVHIKFEYSPIEVWKTLDSLLDKSDDVLFPILKKI